MKIDMDLIRTMVTAGASGSVVLAYLAEIESRMKPRRVKDKDRKRTAKVRKDAESVRNVAENERQTVDDTPKARLFREGSGALVLLGKTNGAARQFIGSCLKLTHDDHQLVLATILRARDLAIAEPAGWILATLKGKANGNGSTRRNKSLADAADDLIARAEEFGGEGPIVDLDDAGTGFESREAARR